MTTCELSDTNVFNVDPMAFIAGSYQELRFHMYEDDMTSPLPLTGATNIELRVSLFGQPDWVVLTKVGSNENIDPYNIAVIKLTTNDTSALSGKYMYQLILTDINNVLYIPAQGIMTILTQIQ